MKSGTLVCGALAVTALGAVALSLLLGRPAQRPVPRHDLPSVGDNVVMPRPRLPDPLELDRLDPKRLILYREHDLRPREEPETHEHLLKAIRKFESAPRRQWPP